MRFDSRGERDHLWGPIDLDLRRGEKRRELSRDTGDLAAAFKKLFPNADKLSLLREGNRKAQKG